MKIQILEKKYPEMKFLLEGVTPGFANELRKIMMVEVPTMAIEWVDFKKNDSILNDEIVANRLGQIPLTFEKKAYELNATCKCEGKGCSRCQVKLVLKKKGPGMVYSGDLKTKAKDVQPVFDKIPIVELFEDQSIELEATAQLGFGKEHIKWQGAIVGYKNKPVKEVAKKDENDETKYVEDSFIFNVETVSGYSPEELAVTAGEILEEKMKDFDKNLKKLK
jgi:DNA-directed RNA polymerase subunit D